MTGVENLRIFATPCLMIWDGYVGIGNKIMKLVQESLIGGNSMGGAYVEVTIKHKELEDGRWDSQFDKWLSLFLKARYSLILKDGSI